MTNTSDGVARPFNTKAIKNGAAHLHSLRDDRSVYIDGRLVHDVTTDPAFANSVHSAAALYDYQANVSNADVMTFTSPTCARRVNRAWQLPTNYSELVLRRQALVQWAETHNGFMGRSPDHVASALAGQYMGMEVFEKYNGGYAGNFRSYFQYARDNDLFLSYVIINPQGNRAVEPSRQPNDFVLHVVDETAEGIVVSGAKMLGTSAIMANELFVANLQPLRAHEEKYAVSFAIPMATGGLRLLSRKSYEASAVSRFDNPISSRFDENDALVYFDEVLVPRDRIFVNQSPDMCRAQFHDTPGHVFQNYQSQIRLTVKLRFLVGVARRICDTIGTTDLPPVQATLGKLASEVAAVDAFVLAMEVAGEQRGEYFVPNRHLLYAAQVYTQDLYSEFITTIRDLAGGSLLMLPSSIADLEFPLTRKIVECTQVSERGTALDRVKFLKLAWDVLGSEFASRHQQYEMFYAGAKFVTRGHCFRSYDWERATSMLDAVVAGYSLEASSGAENQRRGESS